MKKKKKIMLQKTSSLLPERENSCQKSEALDHMFAKNLMTGFVFTPSFSSSFFVSRTATFEPFVNPPLCNLRLKTAAIRWQLWTFHLSAISRRSESSVCLSKLFSVFNLSCFSVFSLSSTPRCSPFLSPRFDSRRCERFWWEECPQWFGCYC